MMKQLLALGLVFSSHALQANFYGIEEAKAVFAKEISFVENVYNTIEKKGNFSPIIQSPVMAFVRKNHAALSHEIEILCDVMQTMYANPEVLAAVKVANAAVNDFVRDPLLMKTRSGKEIIMLESYQNIKRTHEAVKLIERSFYKAAAAQIPLLTLLLDRLEQYIDEVFFNRIESALTCLSWDDTLEAMIDDMRDMHPGFDALFSQAEEVAGYLLSDRYIEQMVVSHQSAKRFIAAVLACCGNTNVMRTVSALRVVRTVQDQRTNADSLVSLMSDADVQNLLQAAEQLAQAVPAV